MHIAMGGHWHPLPPHGYAGVERVVTWWIEELTKRGHTITLVGNPRSTIRTRHKVPVPNPDTAGDRYYRGFGQARALGAQIVHDNNDHQEPDARRWDGPYVFTVHACVWKGNPNPIFLSEHQARWHKYQGTPTVVYNGIKAEDYPFCRDKEDYLFWCASIRDCKAPEMAVQLARDSGLRLKIAGPIQDSQYDWLRELPKGGQIEYLGELDKERIHYYQHAAAFLYTCSDTWMEGFNLTNIEAQLCGTPVIALRTPANAIAGEQLLDESTGSVCDGYDKMLAALKSGVYKSFAPEACRARGEYFSIARAIDGYLAAYERAIRGERW